MSVDSLWRSPPFQSPAPRLIRQRASPLWKTTLCALIVAAVVAASLSVSWATLPEVINGYTLYG